MAQQCNAKAKSTGVQCARYAIEGGTTCRVHGSGSKTAKAAAKRRIAEAKATAEAEKAVTLLGLPRDINPTDALLEEIRWTAGHVEWARKQVQALDAEGLTWGLDSQKETRGEKFETTYTEKGQLSVWYGLYMREREHLAKVCALALRSGVEERRVRVAEAYADQVCGLIDRLLVALDLSAEQAARAPELVASELRILATS